MTVREFQVGRFRRMLLTRCGFSVRVERGTTEYEEALDADRTARFYARMDDETATKDLLGNLR